MGTGKQIAIAAALIVVIAGAVFFIIKTIRNAPKAPAHIKEMEVFRIDTVTLERMTLPLVEWEKLGERDGIYKNPDTGEYTMSPAKQCENPKCGKWMVEPRPPADLFDGIDLNDPKSEAEAVARSNAWERSVKCPHCGKCPF